ncbi:unnamed protein product [Paramecium primaurelia]|uniref:Uncharacterized protein n=1 Tax=Paramecium primaurelia TaxID=5886 RepID=A0A8S1PIE4_PARPR|nr:unnamed protein product [Paramecium primaurelia]
MEKKIIIENSQHPEFGDIQQLIGIGIRIGDIQTALIEDDYFEMNEQEQSDYFHKKGIFNNFDDIYFSLGEFEAIHIDNSVIENYNAEDDLKDVPLIDITITNSQLSDKVLNHLLQSINVQYLQILNLSNNQLGLCDLNEFEQIIDILNKKGAKNIQLNLKGNPIIQKYQIERGSLPTIETNPYTCIAQLIWS